MASQMTDPVQRIAAFRREMADMAALWQDVAARTAPRARAEAEAQVFNQMVVALDARFGNDARGARGQQEVRLLARGVANGGWFPEDAAARWRPDASVTGYHPGDRIALDSEAFWRLAGMFLDGVAQQSRAMA